MKLPQTRLQTRHKSRNQRIQAGAIALSVSILFCSKADAFSFYRIADTSITSGFSSISPGLSTPWGTSDWGTQILNRQDIGSAFQNQMGLAFNSKGQVAYFAQLKTGGTALVLYDPKSKQNINIAITGSEFSSFNPGISLNENGEVAFSAVDKKGITSIKVGNPKTTGFKTIADTTGNFSSFAPGLSINDSGTVAFWGNSSKYGDKYKDVYIGNGNGNLTNVSKCSPPVGPVQILTPSNGIECPVNAQRPSINNKGEVAFVGDNGVFKWDAGIIYKIMSDPYTYKNGSYHDPNINDLGRVSYGAWRNVSYNSANLLTSDGNTNYLIAGNTLPLHSIGRSASINNQGEMAFIGEPWTGYRDGQGYGIFSGMPDYMSPTYGGDSQKALADMLKRDKVIAVGDPLLNSTVVALSMDRESRNDQDQITFWAKLANGIQGIFRADPSPGDSQWNPLMPTSGTTGKNGTLWSFINTPGRVWFDPIPAEGFNFKMTSDSLFTEIMNFPANFTKPFLVKVKDILLGEFTAGDKVKFSDYSYELADLLKDGFGVQEFTISGISVDPSSPTAFPIKLDFSTETASFDMIAILSKTETTPSDGHRPNFDGNEEEVPEPTTMLGTLLFGAIAAKIKRQRALAKKAAN
ncbi:hypothetical protein BCD67_09740 [Oscillatoriales cyanobacterium USR001]|nr:hypothetical protein BCD67_09740 [Oscillatoriales cyanobacterium USR001]